MMTIVHNALRRDLERATTALSASPPPGDRQRTAIAGHLGWMMDFLRAHHESEDKGLYPAVRERRPGASDVLDRMPADHEAIHDRIGEVEAAAEAYGRSGRPEVREQLAQAIGDLREVLLPHLQREEDDAMPIVADTLTEGEWAAIEHEHNLKGKTQAQLAKEGHWLIDGVSPEDRATVLGLVPAVPRFVMVHGYGRRYRHERDLCWDPSARERKVQKHGYNAFVVDADPEAVWSIVFDITRTGEWSHECVSCELLDGATEVEPGARFQGRNKQGRWKWGRICEVVSTDDHQLVWRTVPTALTPDSSEWRIKVSPTDGGTLIEQSFDVIKAPKWLDPILATLVPAHQDRSEALADDMKRLGELARSEQMSLRPAV